VKQFADGGKEGGAAVDGKHPKGSIAHQGHVPAAQGIHGGENDFHAPADEAAFEKIFCKLNDAVFHNRLLY